MKYHSRKTVVDGITFDSRAEANRYWELKMMEKGGLIRNLEVHPAFLLQDGFSYKGKKERPIHYEADFSYFEGDTYVVEDVKGEKTQVYNIKRKMLLRQYGDKIDFREVMV